MQLVRCVRASLVVAVLSAGVWSAPHAQTPPPTQTPPLTPDIPPSFSTPNASYDYEKREAMIPMRDGVKLYTVMIVPKRARSAPMLLTRTPYNAAQRVQRSQSMTMVGSLPLADELYAGDGYIRVYQDVRGKYKSEGDYVMTRPLRGPLNPSAVDHSTDAYDTIEWLVKNVPESNGKVGMIGSSYDGFTVVMALVDPHPALKVAVPESPMVDGWMGDDWFHFGAFRQTNFDYFTYQTTAKGEGRPIVRQDYDDYTNFLRAGSAGDFARAAGLDQLPWWRKVSEHPAYDQFWQAQALDKVMAAQPLKVPTMWLQGLWDQEDMWGGIHAYQAVEPRDTSNTMNYLAMGPWYHSQINREGFSLGPLRWSTDTTAQFRQEVLKPFLDQYLKDSAPKADTPPVMIYNTGENHWDRLKAWPLSCEEGCPSKSQPLYLAAHGGLSFRAPAGDRNEPDSYEEYVSDPMRPVPFSPRPTRFADSESWRRWLVTDQRFVDGRPDVLTYVTEPLTSPLRVSGTPRVNLMASTTGTDSDWVVKLIDVFPGEVPSRPEFGGYELPIAMDIFRGRYRESFETPHAIARNTPLPYRFILPTVNHVFQPGHRVMVQVQSTWFPLYDRNPQTFVPNVFFATPADYAKATQRVYHGAAAASFIELPVASAGVITSR
jgi:putative CocE/NonD family hydrolase